MCEKWQDAERSVNTKVWFIVGHFVFTDRRSIEARPVRNRLIFQCDCFARFAVVLRHLAGNYEIQPHSKAEVRNRDWRKRVSGIENRLSRKPSGSWTYRLLGHNRYEPSGACTGRECGEKWRILRIRRITERKDNLCNISVFNTDLHRKIHNAANNHDISYLLWTATVLVQNQLAHCQTRNTVTLAHCLFDPECCECNSGQVGECCELAA